MSVKLPVAHQAEGPKLLPDGELPGTSHAITVGKKPAITGRMKHFKAGSGGHPNDTGAEKAPKPGTYNDPDLPYKTDKGKAQYERHNERIATEAYEKQTGKNGTGDTFNAPDDDPPPF